MIFKALLACIFVYLAFPLCADPTQPQNQCTQCVSNDILINGTCYVKIRGCLIQSAGPTCSECQFGYVLVSPVCIREAVFFNNTNISVIPPVIITPPETLTYDEIKNKLGDQNSPNFSTAHQYFLLKYTSQLGKGNIKDVNYVITKTGIFIIIIYQADNKILYEATSFFNVQKVFYQWSFNKVQGFMRNLWVAQNLTQQALGDQIKNYFIYQIYQALDTLTIDYINTQNSIKRVTFNLNDIANATSLASKIQVKVLTVSDIGVQKIVTLYPKMADYPVTSIETIGDYKIVYFGPTISVSFTFKNYVIKVNQPLRISTNSYLSSDSSFKNLLFNGFSLFANFLDPQFVASGQYIAKQFPETIGAAITKVQTQTSTTTSYRISMTKLSLIPLSIDSYQFCVWFNTSNLAYLIEGKKNLKIIYEDYHNYNADSVFLTSYNIVENTSKIVDIPPISSVLFKLTDNIQYYKVIYSRSQFAEFQYLTDTKKAKLLSYYVDGQNLLDLAAGKITQKRTPDDLLAFIKSQQAYINLAVVKQIVYNLPTYLVTIVTYLGSYKAQIADKSGQLSLVQLTKIDTQTCIDLNLNSPQVSGARVKSIDDLTRQSYPLDGYNIQALQVNVGLTTISYRVLYANSNLKQIVALLQEYNSVVNILKISFSNEAYEVLDSNPNNPDYQTILAVLNASDLAGNKIPVFTENNGTFLKAYYNDGKSTYQIFYDEVANKAYSQIFFTRAYSLVPDGFSLQNLLIPGTPSAVDNATLAKIIKLANIRYGIAILNSTILFADKVNTTYNIMLKGIFGCSKIQGTFINGVASLVKFSLTTYKESDFSNCKKFDPTTGRCLSCDVQTEVQYQGYCYRAMEGCLIQLGTICARCNPDYIKHSQQCLKSCTNFFA